MEQCDIQPLSAAGESESEDDDDSDFDEQPLAKRKKPAPKKPAGQSGPKRPPPKGKKVIWTPHIPDVSGQCINSEGALRAVSSCS